MKTFIYLILFVFIAGITNAQQYSTDFVFANPVFQNYTMKNGLAANYCYDVLQDKKGYIWVATLNGLNRFNGNKWQLFQQQNINKRYKLPANWVIDIDEDEAGNIWINTDRGIAQYVSKLDSIVAYTSNVKGWGKLACGNGNKIFVSSWTGVEQFKYEHNTLITQKKYNETNQNSIFDLYTHTNNTLWACLEDNPSLVKINTLTQQLTYYKNILLAGVAQPIVINAITYYSQDTLLLSTKNKGVLKYCTTNNTAFYFLNNIVKHTNEINCTALYTFNNQHYVLVGTRGNGMYVVNVATQHYQHYKNNINEPTSILANTISAIVIDDNNGVWIATNKGLSYFHASLQKNNYYYFYNNSTIPSEALINCVSKINSATYLIGTDNNGLFLYTDDELKTIQPISINNYKQVRIASIEKLNSCTYLLATSKGLFSYDATTHKCTAQLINGKLFNYPMLRGRMLANNTMALCTHKGLLVYNTSTNKIIYNELNKNKNTSENLFCKDAYLNGDNLYILRFFNGYEVYNIKTNTLINCTPAIIKNKPIDYHNITANDTTLFISSTTGIITQTLANIHSAKLLRTEHGLQGDNIQNVYAITNSQLYYTTPEGLYNYNLKNQTSNRIISYENYTQKWCNQLALTADSLLLYTVSDYFIAHKPFLKINNNKCPAYVIEQVLINGKPHTLVNDELILPHNQNNITIQLAGLVYPEAEKNTWYYQLNKLDTAIKTTNTGQIQLHNLPPNNYTLTIYSINNEGLRATVNKTITICISKPFYATWWFYVLILVIIISTVCLLYMYKKKQNEHLLKIRSQISRDLHDELGANVSSINIMARMLLSKQNGEHNTVLTNISKYSVQISDTINDIIWNVNPKFDSVDELIKKMTRYASESLEAAQINYNVTIPTTAINVELNNQLKYQLYLVFKEGINNAAKYSQANTVNIIINYTNTVFSFSIYDDGIGFNANASDNGNGLNNMRTRANDMHAQLNINSELKKGTHINLFVKLT